MSRSSISLFLLFIIVVVLQRAGSGPETERKADPKDRGAECR